MKTKEFIEEVRDLGLFVDENKNQNMIWIKAPYEDNYVGEVKTDEIGCRIFDESKKFPGISKLIYEYGMTPLEEREEEERYVYELPVLDWSSERLCLYKTSHEYKKLRVTLREDLIDKELLYFTDKEVEQYTGKSRLLFDACEKIEVAP